jgi:hypothetical protein
MGIRNKSMEVLTCLSSQIILLPYDPSEPKASLVVPSVNTVKPIMQVIVNSAQNFNDCLNSYRKLIGASCSNLVCN